MLKRNPQNRRNQPGNQQLENHNLWSQENHEIWSSSCFRRNQTCQVRWLSHLCDWIEQKSKAILKQGTKKTSRFINANQIAWEPCFKLSTLYKIVKHWVLWFHICHPKHYWLRVCKWRRSHKFIQAQHWSWTNPNSLKNHTKHGQQLNKDVLQETNSQ